MFICIYVTLVIGSQVCCQYLVCITCVCVCVCVCCMYVYMNVCCSCHTRAIHTLYVCIYECMLLLAARLVARYLQVPKS
jgi:hypothetical protein